MHDPARLVARVRAQLVEAAGKLFFKVLLLGVALRVEEVPRRLVGFVGCRGRDPTPPGGIEPAYVHLGVLEEQCPVLGGCRVVLDDSGPVAAGVGGYEETAVVKSEAAG